MARPFTPVLNPSGASQREISERVNRLLSGKINSVGEITLDDTGATSTTLVDANIGPDSVILFSPLTSNAAAFMTVLYVSARSSGAATLTHSANSAPDRTFGYVVLG